MVLTRKVCIKTNTLLKELEFCLLTNYLIRKYIWFYFQTLLTNVPKISSKEICLILFSNIVNKLASNISFEKLKTTVDWTKIDLLWRLATIDTTLGSFLYKILNNLLFLNQNLYNFEITDTALCSLCKTFEEKKLQYIPFMIAFILNLGKMEDEILEQYDPAIT